MEPSLLYFSLPLPAFKLFSFFAPHQCILKEIPSFLEIAKVKKRIMLAIIIILASLPLFTSATFYSHSQLQRKTLPGTVFVFCIQSFKEY